MAVRADDLPVPRGRPRLAGRVREWLDHESILGPVFVTPALLLLVLLVAYPFVMALYFSMSNAFIGRPSRWVGLHNFIALWDSDVFRQTFQNAFVFTSIAVAFKLVFGICLALLLNEQLWFKRFIRGAVLLPWVIPTALSTLGWWWMFLALQRGELDGHRGRVHGSARAKLARPEVLRDDGRGDGQRVAGAALLRHHHPRGARRDSARALRGGGGRRRRPRCAHVAHPAPRP